MDHFTTKYQAKLRHDAGVVFLNVYATSYTDAIATITAAEKCPERSILSIKRMEGN